jgi:hypothetical protein
MLPCAFRWNRWLASGMTRPARRCAIQDEGTCAVLPDRRSSSSCCFSASLAAGPPSGATPLSASEPRPGGRMRKR